MNGAHYALVGGFWGIIATIQTPGAPSLTITRADRNVILSWPASAAGYELELNNNLALPNGWSAVVHSTNVVGTQITVSVPSSMGNSFYRLRKP
jgi:hypothetical protein